MTNKPVWVGMLIVSCAAGLQAATAYACSGPLYCASEVAVVPRDVVPVNLGGVLVDLYAIARFTANHVDGAPRAAGIDMQLHAEDAPQTALPVRVEPRDDGFVWLAFDQPLVEGKHYTLHFGESCEGRALDQTVAFVAGQQVEAPTTLGPLSVVREGRQDVTVGVGSTCSRDVSGDVVDFNIADSDSRLLARYGLVVDGEPWQWRVSMSTGFYRVGGTPRELPYWFDDPGTFRVWTLCAGAELGPDWGLPPGKHTVRVRAELLGATPGFVESEPLEVDLSCDGPTGQRDDGAVPPEGEANPGSDDASAAGGRGDKSRDERSSSGCSAGPATRSHGGWLVLFGLALVFARRATRGRRRA